MLRRTVVDFSTVLRDWDGFGVNYVETCQTADYDAYPQDYGGFSILSEDDRRKVLDMVFGEEGLRPGIIKMFLDPWHQPEPAGGYEPNDPRVDGSAYDHERTTEWMRYFAREGLKLTRGRGHDLQFIVTLYGPPPWMTRQKSFRGRDLDPELKVECAKYLAAFAGFLRREEGLPVRYLSLHNEGEDWTRWNPDGTHPGGGHDYNLYWPPEQVVEFLRFMPELLEENGLADIGVTPGETSNWQRFVEWGYAAAIAEDAEAAAGLGLITSHGFYSPGFHRWAGDYRSTGIDLLREPRPELHAWTTSTSWSEMDVRFLAELRDAVYVGKLNGLIPWACIQRPALWEGGDPNPGTAFRVSDDGELSVEPGYWWYKQVCRAGQAGTGVARVVSNDTQVPLLAFADNGSAEGDAAVVLNTSEEPRDIELELIGTAADRFRAVRTSTAERCAEVGVLNLTEGGIPYCVPPQSATTFFSLEA